MSHKHGKVRWLAVLAMGFMFMAGTVWAQSVTTASFSGVVKDQNGQPVYGANVVATHVPSGTVFGAATRADGRYNIPFVRVGGPYSLTVNFIGYKKETRDGIMLALSENKQVNFTLVEEAVELEGVEIVVERNPIISEARTGAAKTVTTIEIETLPTIERSFTDFAKLTPQFSGNSAAGRNNRYNNIQIDGAVNNDLFGLNASGTPGGGAGTTPISLDAIQEFQVVIAPFDVRMGGFTGGGINAITRSGTNKFDGSIYYYFRNESFVGKDIDGNPYPKFNEKQMGFRVGGPILKDKLFFFVNGELTRKDAPTTQWIKGDSSNTDFLGIPVDSAAEFVRILRERYGYDPGTFGKATLKTNSNKFFVRLDWNISEKHHLTFRNNFITAFDDKLVRNVGNSASSSTAGFRLSKAGYALDNVQNSSVLQLTSQLSSNMYNEAILGYSMIRDKRKNPGKPFPSVWVRFGADKALVAGTEVFSAANELDQDIIEFTNNFNYYLGNHTLTFGTHNEFFSFRNLFIRDFHGTYTFNSLARFRNGTPDGYSLSYSLDTNNLKPAAEFSVNQLGFYAQDVWKVMPNFNLTMGLRYDVPLMPDKPTQNDTVEYYFGKKTNSNAGGNGLFSPRIGVNWDVFNDKKTQVRGGIGIFSGRSPYVWVSNQYSNTGADFGRTTTNPGVFVTKVDSQPGKVYVAPRSEINLIDTKFKMPQIWRFNLGVDHTLPWWDLVATIDFVASKNINEILYQDINLKGISSYLPLGELDTVASRRARWGATRTSSSPAVVNSARFSNVIYLSNTDNGYEYNFTIQLTKNMSKGFFGSAAYTYGRAFTANNGTSSQAISNWRFNPVKENPNSPEVATSNYEVRHKIITNLSYQFELVEKWTTTVSMFYIGRSGQPYSTTYNGDVNADGQTSNDLIYVPKDSLDINLIPYTVGGRTYTVGEQRALLEAYINGDPALKKNRGKVISRNASTTPWNNRVDLRLAQNIPVGDKWGRLELTWDIINFMNVLNKEWGQYKYVINQNDSPIRFAGVNAAGKPTFTFTRTTKERFVSAGIGSLWQMQFGFRYTF